MNKKKYSAEIKWLKKEDGGRNCPIPMKEKLYCPTLSLEGKMVINGSSWSVFCFNEEMNENFVTKSFLKYANQDSAPDVMKIGDSIELYEGEKKVAVGKITGYSDEDFWSDSSHKQYEFTLSKEDNIRFYSRYLFLRWRFLIPVAILFFAVGVVLCLLGSLGYLSSPGIIAGALLITTSIGVAVGLVLMTNLGPTFFARSLSALPASCTVLLTSEDGLSLKVGDKTLFTHVIDGKAGYRLFKSREAYFLLVRKNWFFPIPRNAESKAVLAMAGVRSNKL
jgi:hypothetical protein